MRYSEIIETKNGAESLRIDGLKKRADMQMLAAKKSKQKAKQAELTFKQQQTADALLKLDARVRS